MSSDPMSWARRLRDARSRSIDPHSIEAYTILQMMIRDPDIDMGKAFTYIRTEYPTTPTAYLCLQIVRENDSTEAKILQDHAKYLLDKGKDDPHLCKIGTKLKAKARKLQDASSTATHMRLAYDRDLYAIATHSVKCCEYQPSASIWADPHGYIIYTDGDNVGGRGASVLAVAGCAAHHPTSYMTPKKSILDRIEREQKINNFGAVGGRSITRKGKQAKAKRKARRLATAQAIDRANNKLNS